MVGERRTEREHGPILHMLYCILAAMRLWGIDRCFAVCTLKKLDGSINPLMGTGNYNATSNNMKLVHWPLMDGLLHLHLSKDVHFEGLHDRPKFWGSKSSEGACLDIFKRN